MEGDGRHSASVQGWVLPIIMDRTCAYLSDRLSEVSLLKRDRDRALDFGSGVGRLTLMLHQKLELGFTHVIGVDQSVCQWHARIARSEMERLNLQHRALVLI